MMHVTSQQLLNDPQVIEEISSLMKTRVEETGAAFDFRDAANEWFLSQASTRWIKKNIFTSRKKSSSRFANRHFIFTT